MISILLAPVISWPFQLPNTLCGRRIAEEMAVKETVNKVFMVETYLFLWTSLVLLWTFSVENNTDCDRATELIAISIAEAVLRELSDISWNLHPGSTRDDTQYPKTQLNRDHL
jgi:hypothetical protein